MPPRSGRCTNFSNCKIADTNQVVQIPAGGDLICPECGHQLAEVARSDKSPLGPIVIIAAVLLLLVGGGLLLLMKRGSAGEPSAGRAGSSPGSVILRLHGSNTIGAKLGPDQAAAFLKLQGAQDVKIVPGNADE